MFYMFVVQLDAGGADERPACQLAASQRSQTGM